MFVDHAVIEVKAGKGGDGMIAFRREKYVAFGGPSGGNGGRGGSIYLKADKSLNTLYQFRFSKVILAEEGGKGEAKNKYGRGASDVYVPVPIGTIAKDEKTGRIIANLTKDGQVELVAKGGRGGRGNAAFKSASNKVPKIAENGLPGEEKRLLLELKLLADVGLIGLPNAGKSTLLSVISNAKPEIADYPFTTISPNLGVVSLDKYDSFVVADLPGLIENAHLGKGMGLEFLRHAERCKVLIHVVSMEEENPYENYKIIRKELEQYNLNLSNKKEIIVASKVEDEVSEKKYKDFKKKVKKEVLPICSITLDGIKELLYKTSDLIKEVGDVSLLDEYNNAIDEKVYDARKDEEELFTITKVKDHVFKIEGERVVRTYKIINISTDEGMMKLISYLVRIGIDDKLREMGATDGDTVILEDFEFEYIGW